MKLLHLFTALIFGWLSTFNLSFAATSPQYEQLQIPNCLAQALSEYKVLAQNDSFRIIEVPSNILSKVVKLADKERCGRFVNVSHRFMPNTLLSKKGLAQNLIDQSHLMLENKAQYTISHAADVEDALTKVEPTEITKTLTHLTSYYNRSASSKTGVDAIHWVGDTINEMVTASGRSDVKTFFVKTGWYEQPSLVTVIGKDQTSPGVVLGAHIDTLDGRMPGAGDDGSGSATLLEIGRVLLHSSLSFKRPIYLIWYAAEERGLVGSQFVVDYFKKKAIPVDAAIQFDMTGFRNVEDDSTLWVYEDYTDKKLTKYLVDLIKTYVKMPVKYSKCGYGCSDHASWMDAGVPSVFPCETSYEDHNPAIHSKYDTMDRLNLDHMTNFTKLGLAFAIELVKD